MKTVFYIFFFSILRRKFINIIQFNYTSFKHRLLDKMKKKVNHKNLPESDRFDRKQKRHTSNKTKSSKQKLSIYDEFDDDDLMDYSSSDLNDFDDFDE